MPAKRRASGYFWSIVILLFAMLVTACSSNEAPPDIPNGVRTQLLVKAPETSLPSGTPLNVRSRTEANSPGVSHVELHAVQLPSGQQDVLLRSDAPPFDQTTFTTMQEFTPIETGHYVIKVVGYNKLGQKAESAYISFDVE
ncbi:MAG TPA: hypothetical protein P5526_02980 [Anaerolineae bacterium]|nr:hypothetical protein [Anaerolineae bacterium]MCB0176639.1 hypothetical protein [Anaerolineae bacterium]MCB0222666.1 hypothetical protein [Anaerolineae bacterium]MCB9109195.1 hypothetical protein [Anaerolineales bacterium]HRV91108.1 hypothetical protein [Anaerolineae bacterium]